MISSQKKLFKSRKPESQLVYLEGIKGIAAIYIVLFHVFQECTINQEISPLVLSLTKFMAYGKDFIAVFIVLSGYCLMIPIIKSEKKQLRGGWLNYLKRRGRRTLPTYYVALLLSLLLLIITLSWQHFTGFRWDTSFEISQTFFEVPSLGAILSHFVLLHNLSDDWAYAINNPLWYLATQWQIYLLLPTLLLPLYRNFGLIAMLVIAVIMGETLTYLLSEWHYWTLQPWLLGIFALGMSGAEINFSQKELILLGQNKIPWGLVNSILWISLILIVFPYPAPLGVSRKFAYLIGAATTCLLIYCTHSLKGFMNERRPKILQIFETKPLTKLGRFSYSLYLIHAPVVVIVNQFLILLNISPTIKFLGVLIISLPLSILIAYIFYLKFEKPFIYKNS